MQVVKGPRIMGALSRASTGGYSAVNCLNEHNARKRHVNRRPRPLALKAKLSLHLVRGRWRLQ